MDDEQILAVLEGLTTDGLHRLYAHICRRLPCPLRALGSDMLVHILEQMEHPGDRINFICAVTAGDDPCWTTERISAEIAARLLSDLGECQLTQTIYNVADQIHYTLPSCFRMKSFLFANWTPYSVKRTAELACIYWSQTPPHARVDLNRLQVRAVVRATLSRGAQQLRLTSHGISEVQDFHNTVAVRTRRRGKVHRLFVHPMHIVVCDLLAYPLSWVCTQTLMRRPQILNLIGPLK